MPRYQLTFSISRGNAFSAATHCPPHHGRGADGALGICINIPDPSLRQRPGGRPGAFPGKKGTLPPKPPSPPASRHHYCSKTAVALHSPLSSNLPGACGTPSPARFLKPAYLGDTLHPSLTVEELPSSPPASSPCARSSATSTERWYWKGGTHIWSSTAIRKDRIDGSLNELERCGACFRRRIHQALLRRQRQSPARKSWSHPLEITWAPFLMVG